MKVLLVYPEFPDTFWSFKHALPFQGKRSAFPPWDCSPFLRCCPSIGKSAWWI